MGTFYLKLFEPPVKMRIGNEYTFVFEISLTKPEGDCRELYKERGYYIHVCGSGMGDNWTNGKLVFPFEYDEKKLEINIKPVPPIVSPDISLEFVIKKGEKTLNGFEKKITVIGAESQTGSQSGGYKSIKSVNLKIPEKELANNQGILNVFQNGDIIELYGMSGSSTIAKIPFNVRNPEVTLIESFVGSESPYHEMWGLGVNLYHEMGPVISQWLIILCKQKNPSLLVCDFTDMEIPWELIYMDNDQCRGFWGELLSISRWLRFAKDTEKDGIKLDFFCQSINGNLASYIFEGKKFKSTAEEEIEAVKKCEAISIETKSKLLEFLNNNRKDIVLLHMACHGTFDTGNSQNAAVDLVSALSLSAHEMRLIAHSKPVIFINACHSGRKGRLFWALNSVVYPFIRKGAEGYIAAMGRVRSKEASKIAARIFEEMQKENPPPIAEILRQIREKAVQNVTKDDSEENQKAFLDAFMYIFYGSPLKAVSIKPAQSQGEK